MKTDCPCKKRNCPRHGDCKACREHHANSKKQRPVACEKPTSIDCRFEYGLPLPEDEKEILAKSKDCSI